MNSFESCKNILSIQHIIRNLASLASAALYGGTPSPLTDEGRVGAVFIHCSRRIMDFFEGPRYLYQSFARALPIPTNTFQLILFGQSGVP